MAQVHYTKFNPKNLIVNKPEKKSYDGGDYYSMSSQYLYEDGQQKELCIELGECTTFGVGYSKYEKKKPKNIRKAQIRLTFDISTEEGRGSVEAIEKIQEVFANAVADACKGKKHKFIKKPKSFKQNPYDNNFKNYILWKVDEDGEPIKDKNPNMYINLFKAKFGKAKFYVPSEDKENPTVLSWNKMRGVEAKIIPLIHVRYLYIGGGNIAVQMVLKSAVILEIEKKKDVSQEATLAKHSKTDLIKKLKAQLAKLEAQNEDGSGGEEQEESEGSGEDSGSNKEEDIDATLSDSDNSDLEEVV